MRNQFKKKQVSSSKTNFRIKSTADSWFHFYFLIYIGLFLISLPELLPAYTSMRVLSIFVPRHVNIIYICT
jgi:hypothetical protein